MGLFNRPKSEPGIAQFPPCGHCKSRAFVPTRRADTFVSAGYHYVRQHFVCAECGVSARFVRRIDRHWTSNVGFARRGIQTY